MASPGTHIRLRRLGAGALSLFATGAVLVVLWMGLFIFWPEWRGVLLSDAMGVVMPAGSDFTHRLVRYGPAIVAAGLSFAIGVLPIRSGSPFLRVFGLVLTDGAGRRPNMLRRAARWAALVATFALAGVPALWSLLDREGRTSHDLLSGTRVELSNKAG